MTTLLMAVTLILQEPKTADEVMAKVKDVLGKASSIAIESTIEYREDEARTGPKRETSKARFLITSENKARCEHFSDGRPEPVVISTGDRVGHRKTDKDPFEIYKASLKPFSELTEIMFFTGLYGLPMDLASTGKRAADGHSGDLLARMRARVDPSKYELGAAERKDGRECVLIGCSLTPKGEDKPIASIRLWFDKSTWLPVAREQKFDTPGRKGEIVETYTTIHLNGKIDPSEFHLPEAK